MAKSNKHVESLAEAPAEVSADQAEVLASVGIVTPENRVWSVEIPRCLLRQKFVQATNEAEALEKYKRVCGITAHSQAAIVRPTDLDPHNLPEGVELFGE